MKKMRLGKRYYLANDNEFPLTQRINKIINQPNINSSSHHSTNIVNNQLNLPHTQPENTCPNNPDYLSYKTNLQISIEDNPLIRWFLSYTEEMMKEDPKRIAGKIYNYITESPVVWGSSDHMMFLIQSKGHHIFESFLLTMGSIVAGTIEVPQELSEGIATLFTNENIFSSNYELLQSWLQDRLNIFAGHNFKFGGNKWTEWDKKTISEMPDKLQGALDILRTDKSYVISELKDQGISKDEFSPDWENSSILREIALKNGGMYFPFGEET